MSAKFRLLLLACLAVLAPTAARVSASTGEDVCNLINAQRALQAGKGDLSKLMGAWSLQQARGLDAKTGLPVFSGTLARMEFSDLNQKEKEDVQYLWPENSVVKFTISGMVQTRVTLFRACWRVLNHATRGHYVLYARIPPFRESPKCYLDTCVD